MVRKAKPPPLQRGNPAPMMKEAPKLAKRAPPPCPPPAQQPLVAHSTGKAATLPMKAQPPGCLPPTPHAVANGLPAQSMGHASEAPTSGDSYRLQPHLLHKAHRRPRYHGRHKNTQKGTGKGWSPNGSTSRRIQVTPGSRRYTYGKREPRFPIGKRHGAKLLPTQSFYLCQEILCF